MQRARAVGLNREIVSIQPSAERQRARRDDGLTDRLTGAQHLPLREVDVEVAVVVVVEERDAAAHHLGEIEVARPCR